jgi:hypothetical protein
MNLEKQLALHHWAFEQVMEEYRLALATDSSALVLLEVQVRLNTIREQYMDCLLQANNNRKVA